MKFWFGKKDEEQNGRSDVACAVLAIPDHAAKQEKTGNPFFGVPQMGAGVSVPEAQPAAVEPVLSSKKGDNAPDGKSSLGEVGCRSKEVSSPSDTSDTVTVAKEAASAVAAKPILRPISGSPVRVGLTVSPVSGAPVLVPASAASDVASVADKVAAVGKPATAAAPRAMAFGLRPKATSTPASVAEPTVSAQSAPPAANSVEKVDRSIVRPKTDQRALYYELMNGLYDALLILDDQGHIVDSNARVASVLGYTREDSWDLPIDKVITGMSTQMFEHLKRNLSENHQVLIDARCFRRDGSSFMGEVGVSTLSLTRGGSNMVFAIRNVERRKNAMEEMRKSQAALQIALVPAFVCDTEGFFQIANQALLESFGIPDEAQAKNVRFVDVLPDAARFFLRAACGEKIRETIQVSTPNGPAVKIEISFSPVQSGANVTAVAGSMQQV
jgi:PAS domain S-box-containing protein